MSRAVTIGGSRAAVVVTRLEPMSAADFTAWMAHVATERRWGPLEVAARLGVVPNTTQNWRRHGAPAHVALACHALLRGIGPWRAES